MGGRPRCLIPTPVHAGASSSPPHAGPPRPPPRRPLQATRRPPVAVRRRPELHAPPPRRPVIPDSASTTPPPPVCFHADDVPSILPEPHCLVPYIPPVSCAPPLSPVTGSGRASARAPPPPRRPRLSPDRALPRVALPRPPAPGLTRRVRPVCSTPLGHPCPAPRRALSPLSSAPPRPTPPAGGSRRSPALRPRPPAQAVRPHFAHPPVVARARPAALVAAPGRGLLSAPSSGDRLPRHGHLRRPTPCCTPPLRSCGSSPGSGAYDARTPYPAPARPPRATD